MSLPTSVRQVLRSLTRSPMFTAVTVLTLAVGLGAVISVFTVVHGVLLEPLPYTDSGRLVSVLHKAPNLGLDEMPQSPALYFMYRDESSTFEDSGMYQVGQVAVTGRGEPEQLEILRVTDGVLPILDVEPALGRGFTGEDDSPETSRTVILSHGYWSERFAGDRSVLGQTLIIDGEPTEVIGVMPRDLPFLDLQPALYLPFRFDRGEVFIGNFSYSALARLAPGVSMEQAEADLTRMMWAALDRYPTPDGFSREMLEQAGMSPMLRPLAREVVGDVGNVLWILLGTVGIVLLIACANVTNLFLARGEARRQELAMRSALGAGRARIAGGLLLEGLVLSLGGGALGVALAAAGVRFLVALEPRGLPRLQEVGIDPVIVLFAGALSVLAAGLIGLVPALRLAGSNLVPSLKEGGRAAGGSKRRSFVRGALVTSQVALALVLVAGSGLMIRSFQNLRAIDPGVREPAEVLAFRIAIPDAEVEDNEEVARMHEEILRRLQALPGVESAALTSAVPMEVSDGGRWSDPLYVEDFPTAQDTIPTLRRYKWIAPGYFETTGNPLIAGRDLTWDDLYQQRPVALISERLAREYWQEPQRALGRRIKPYPHSPWREIVGVAGGELDDGVEDEAIELAYWPMVTRDFFTPGIHAPRTMGYAVRSSRVGSPDFLQQVRDTVWAVNPRLPLADIASLETLFDRSMARTSFTLIMLAIAAATALLIGCIGIYGVTSYLVTQRLREIGVRMALGAQRRDVRRLVLGHGLRLAAAGAAAGLVAAFALTRLLQALLHGISAADPLTFAMAGLAVVLLAVVASFLPARRAARVDPIETLRG